MSAVWRAARAAVRRRRLQTAVIGIVALFSSATIVVALALLIASSAPFDRAFARQQGAHAVATFDPAQVSDAALARTARLPEVVAAAGPFRLAVADVQDPPDVPGLGPGPLTMVGRGDPGGPVDRVDLWRGRWATAADEIVLNVAPDPENTAWFPLGAQLNVSEDRAVTVVGYAFSLSRTADAWVTPEQIDALQPTATQMLYRFDDASSHTAIEAGLDAVSQRLPPDTLFGSTSYLTLKEAVAAGPGVYVPFLLVFGGLGLVVAVLIVANVISGAVVSGFRHIGILKALGFTPRQVVAVYLTIVSVPAVVGSAIGTALGHVAAGPLLGTAFRGLGVGVVEVTASPLVDAAVLIGMPAVVALTALVPAKRASGLPAVEAISAGVSPRTGRGLRAQRWLSATRLPRPVSLGLGLPLARPGRTTLTMAAVLLGVITVTFATGLVTTVTRYADATDGNDTVGVRANRPGSDEAVSSRSDPEVEALLRSLPGTAHVTANLELAFSMVGHNDRVGVSFLRGDSDTLGYQEQIVKGRWLERAGEIVVPSPSMSHYGLEVGDRVILGHGGDHTPVTVVGETMAGGPGPGGSFLASWQTLDQIAPDSPVAIHEIIYQVQLTPDADVAGYLAAVIAADPGLHAWDNSGTNDFTVAIISLSTVLTLVLGAVAALGVFNTVLLNTRERRRDLGMLKSIGMTPRQVVVMVVTSMAALGAVGGLLGIPAGIAAHRLIVPIAADAARVSILRSMLAVWDGPLLGLLALAGVAIAVLGALVPARGAARLTIAEVLHNE